MFDDGKLNDSLVNITNTLNELLVELKELRRPYVFLDILPGKINPNLLDVIINNVGKSTAYNISCVFDPPLPYTDTTTLSDMAIFKTQFFLASNQEIRFVYRDLFSILAEGPAFGPKQTNVTVRYEDSKKRVYHDNYVINLERFKGLLSIEQRGLNDLFKELGNIRKELERIQSRGLLIKTPADLEKERNEAEKFHNQLRETERLVTQKKNNKRILNHLEQSPRSSRPL
jgi:hypothetical protein